MTEKSLLALNDRVTAIEKKLNKITARVEKLELNAITYRGIVDKALDKLRKALPHVNFEDPI